MVRVRGSYEYPEGMTPGQAKDGGLHQNLYEDGRLSGHAKFIPDADQDDDEEDEFYGGGSRYAGQGHGAHASGADGCTCHCAAHEQERVNVEELIELLVILVTFAEWSAPRLKKWWINQARPFVQSTRSRLARPRPKRRREEEREQDLDQGQGRQQEQGADLVEEPVVVMDGDEASERFAAALLARLFSEEQMRILSRAWIRDGSSGGDGRGDAVGPTAPASAELERLTPQQIGDNVRAILHENPALLTRDSLSELGRNFSKIKALGARMHAVERRTARKRELSG
jgi:hypothetical protein